MKPEFPDDDVTRSISAGKTFLFVCLVALLVASPVVLDAATTATAQAEYTYRSFQVVGNGNTIETSQGQPLPEQVRGIDCAEEPDRECHLEHRFLDDTVTIERSWGFGGEPEPDYALHYGELYERTYSENDSGRTYGMRPVPGADVLADVAVPVEESPENETIRRIIERERVIVDHRITHPDDPYETGSHDDQLPVYEYEGSYYVLDVVSVRELETPTALGLLSALELGLSVTGMLASALFLRRYDRIEL